MHALEWAAAEARLRQATLRIVSAWFRAASVYAGSAWTPYDPEVVDELQREAEQQLDDTLTGVASSLAGIRSERSVIEGPAASVLLEAAQDADLLVVGTRGHGGFTGLLLGSVSQQCAAHSPCPVAIVPPRRG
jgi:nucleotide-binding universal stress UspA family protein